MYKFSRYVTDAAGNVQTSGTVTVSVTGGGPATIYSDNTGSVKANPFTIPSTGLIEFFIANGRFDVQAVTPAGTVNLTSQLALDTDTLAGNISISDNLTVGGTASITGNTSITGNLTVGGTTTFSSLSGTADFYRALGGLYFNNATTPNTKLDMKASFVKLYNPSNFQTVVRTATGTITNDIATNGANGRDTVTSFSANTWIYFYWIWNGTTLATLSSINAPSTGPTLPTGYTHWCHATTIRYDATPKLVSVTATDKFVAYNAPQLVSNSTTGAIALTALAPTDTTSVVYRLFCSIATNTDATTSIGVGETSTSGVFYTNVTHENNGNANSASSVEMPYLNNSVYLTYSAGGNIANTFEVDVIGYKF